MKRGEGMGSGDARSSGRREEAPVPWSWGDSTQGRRGKSGEGTGPAGGHEASCLEREEGVGSGLERRKKV